MTALGTLLSIQIPDWDTDDLTFRQMASGDDERAIKAQRILKDRAKAGEQKYQPEVYAIRLCVICDAILEPNHPTNTCPRCSKQP